MRSHIARLVAPAAAVAVTIPILLVPAASGGPARTFVDDVLTR